MYGRSAVIVSLTFQDEWSDSQSPRYGFAKAVHGRRNRSNFTLGLYNSKLKLPTVKKSVVLQGIYFCCLPFYHRLTPKHREIY